METASLALVATKFIAYPNPFVTSTTVSFTLPYLDEQTTVEVFDVRGVKIQTIFKGIANANQAYEIKFDGQNIAAGTYFFRLTTAKETKNFKAVMID